MFNENIYNSNLYKKKYNKSNYKKNTNKNKFNKNINDVNNKEKTNSNSLKRKQTCTNIDSNNLNNNSMNANNINTNLNNSNNYTNDYQNINPNLNNNMSNPNLNNNMSNPNSMYNQYNYNDPYYSFYNNCLLYNSYYSHLNHLSHNYYPYYIDYSNPLNNIYREKNPNFYITNSGLLSPTGEKKWVKFNIENLGDLIKIAQNFGKDYSETYEYNINLKMLSNMIEELENLNNMIGLHKIKNQIVDIILYYSQKLDDSNQDMLHTVIEGEPGTGKTELAEKIAAIYLKMGLLTSSKIKKVKRSDLIAGYLGQTALKTEKILEECKGGVLFIDEAYSLGNAEGKDGKDSFSKECIDLLNQALTENKTNFVCIIAGYKDDLKKSFFSYNSGLERRFPIRFEIDSYTDLELSNILIKKIRENKWEIKSDNLENFMVKNRKYFKYNGGDMENLFAKCKIAHCRNLLQKEEKEKKLITDEDLELGLKIYLENPEIKERDNTNISCLYSMYI